VFRTLGGVVGVLAVAVGLLMLFAGSDGVLAPLSLIALGAYFLSYAFTGLSVYGRLKAQRARRNGSEDA
jgi:hypothetical protein